MYFDNFDYNLIENYPAMKRYGHMFPGRQQTGRYTIMKIKSNKFDSLTNWWTIVSHYIFDIHQRTQSKYS